MKLTVKEAMEKDDVGKGFARIDPKILKELDVSERGAIRLDGKKTTVVKAASAHRSDRGRSIIRLDGFIRKNCDIEIDEEIEVTKAEVQNAIAITLSPRDESIDVDRDFVRFIQDRLMGWYVTSGDIVVVTMMKHAVVFTVDSIEPDGFLVIDPKTKMTILNYPKGIKPLDCAFQKRVSDDELLCSLTIRDNESNQCLIGICPLYQSWMQNIKKK